MYRLLPSARFRRKAKDLHRHNPRLKKSFEKAINQLAADPFHGALKTHRVDIQGEKLFSSRVTGDLRIIWDFDRDHLRVIDLLDIGGHSGSKTVYRR